MLLKNLKETTKQKHQTSESLNFTSEIFQYNLSLQQYKKLILRNHIFNREIEKLLIQLKGYNDVKMSNQTLQDIKLLNIDIPDFEYIVKPLDKDEILGYLYVRNGSSLGTKIISNHLQKTENLMTEVKEFNFYSSNSKHPNWMETMAYINENFNNEQAVTKGANDAFDFFIKISNEI